MVAILKKDFGPHEPWFRNCLVALSEFTKTRQDMNTLSEIFIHLKNERDKWTNVKKEALERPNKRKNKFAIDQVWSKPKRFYTQAVFINVKSFLAADYKRQKQKTKPLGKG